MKLTLALVLVTAGPVAGQEIAFSPAVTATCLATATDLPGREACIGEAADACIDTPDGYTTVGMGFCYGAERDWWDARLNAAYAALLQLEEASDAEMKSYGAAALPAAPALRNMERAWIAFRDAACLWEVSQWGGGTGGGPAGAACAMLQTARQALALEGELEERRAR